MAWQKRINTVSLFSVVLFFLLWQVIVSLRWINPILISSPYEIYMAGKQMILTDSFLNNFFVSFQILIVGYGLAVIFGIGIGFLMGFRKNFNYILRPYIVALNAIPIVAIMPLLVVWFGFGMFSKILAVFLISIVPILFNTIDGLKRVNVGFIKMAHSFGADEFNKIKSVYFFDVLPFIFAGLKIAAGRSFLGLLIAEVFGYGKGLGFLISYYGSTMQTAKLMFIIFILVLINVFFLKVISLCEKKVIFWKN